MSNIIELELKLFNQDFTAKTLIEKTYYYEFGKIDDLKLISIYQYSKFVNCLLKYPSMRSKEWRTSETATLQLFRG